MEEPITSLICWLGKGVCYWNTKVANGAFVAARGLPLPGGCQHFPPGHFPWANHPQQLPPQHQPKQPLMERDHSQAPLGGEVQGTGSKGWWREGSTRVLEQEAKRGEEPRLGLA